MVEFAVLDGQNDEDNEYFDVKIPPLPVLSTLLETVSIVGSEASAASADTQLRN